MSDSTQLTRVERIKLAEQAHAERRIIQHDWRRDEEGRHMVCALAAFGPDINGAGDCPADLMPRWMAELVPSIDDGIASDQVFWFSGELIVRARKWTALDEAAWDRIRTGFLIGGIKQSLGAASKVHSDPAPPYWGEVTDACNQVIAALRSGQDLEAARSAAWSAARSAESAARSAESAARSAARSAESAAWSAESAARSAESAAWSAESAAWSAESAAWSAESAARSAESAAWSAESAAWSAESAAWSAESAAWSAESAWWKELATLLFNLIDAELPLASADA